MKKLSFLTTIALASLFATSSFAQVRRDYRKAPAPKAYRSIAPSVKNFFPKSGIPGTRVTVKGKHFARGTNIVYGGVNIAPQTATPSKLTFLVPAGARDASIALDLPRYRRHLYVGSFDVTAPPPPLVQTTEPKLKRKRLRRKRLLKAERRRHNVRVTKLKRMLKIVQSMRGYDGLTRRIRAAIKKENRRHKIALLRIKRKHRRVARF